MNTDNTVSTNYSTSDTTIQQYNSSNCLLEQLYCDVDLDESEGYTILKDFIDEFKIDLTTCSESDPVKFDSDENRIAERFLSVQIQPFEIKPTENFNKVIHVGDIHGDFKSFYTVLLVFFREQMLNSNIAIVFTGDYVDRGNDSVLCLLLVATFMKKCVKNVFFLKGNHETHNISYFKYDLQGLIIAQQAIGYFITTLSATVILTVNGAKTMFIHGTPIVDKERRKEIFNDNFKWNAVENLIMDAVLANTREELEKIVNDFIDQKCRFISKHYDNPQEVRIYDSVNDGIKKYIKNLEGNACELENLDIKISDRILEWEEQIPLFVDYLKTANVANMFKDIHAEYNKEEWNKFIETPIFENLPTENIIVRFPKELFEETQRKCQDFIRKVSEFIDSCSSVMKFSEEHLTKTVKTNMRNSIYNFINIAKDIKSDAMRYLAMLFRATNEIHQRIPRDNFEKAIKKHATEKLTFKEIIALEKKEIARRTPYVYDSEILWGDINEYVEEDCTIIPLGTGRQQTPPKLVDEYMYSSNTTIIFRGHQCPKNKGWDVYINGKLSKNELEKFVEQNGIKKVFTKKLTEGDRMISTCHTSAVYEREAPRTFVVSNGLTVEAYRII